MVQEAYKLSGTHKASIFNEFSEVRVSYTVIIRN